MNQKIIILAPIIRTDLCDIIFNEIIINIYNKKQYCFVIKIKSLYINSKKIILSHYLSSWINNRVESIIVKLDFSLIFSFQKKKKRRKRERIILSKKNSSLYI